MIFTQLGQYLSHDMSLAPETGIDGCCYNPRIRNCFPIYLPR